MTYVIHIVKIIFINHIPNTVLLEPLHRHILRDVIGYKLIILVLSMGLFEAMLRALFEARLEELFEELFPVT